MKQKGRAGGGRKKKPQPSSRAGSPEEMEASPAAAAAPGAEGSQASPSLSPAVEGGRTGNPFEEEEREAVLSCCACDLRSSLCRHLLDAQQLMGCSITSKLYRAAALKSMNGGSMIAVTHYYDQRKG